MRSLFFKYAPICWTPFPNQQNQIRYLALVVFQICALVLIHFHWIFASVSIFFLYCMCLSSTFLCLCLWIWPPARCFAATWLSNANSNRAAILRSLWHCFPNTRRCYVDSFSLTRRFCFFFVLCVYQVHLLVCVCSDQNRKHPGETVQNRRERKKTRTGPGGTTQNRRGSKSGRRSNLPVKDGTWTKVKLLLVQLFPNGGTVGWWDTKSNGMTTPLNFCMKKIFFLYLFRFNSFSIIF